jgi:hypothetical protein
MNRWISMLVSVLVISIIGYTIVQIYGSVQSRYQAMEDKQSELALQVSDLNDRMVAVSRDTKSASQYDSNDAAADNSSISQIFPQHWLKQTLQLAQAQLEQEQTQFASQATPFRATKETLDLVKLNLNALVASQTISALSATALTRAIDVDLQMIDDEAKAERQDIQLLDRQMAQLQFSLDQMAQKGPAIHTRITPDHSTAQSNVQATAQSAVQTTVQSTNQPTIDLSFMQRIKQLFIIEKPAQDVRSNMLQRGLICREVALTLGLARKALSQGQWDQVIQLLADSRRQLTGLVDIDAKRMQASIASLTIKPHAKLQITALKWLPADIVAADKSTFDDNAKKSQVPVLSRVGVS